MSESGDRKAGTTDVPAQTDPASGAEASDISDLTRTQANDDPIRPLASLAQDSDETLIMNRSRESPGRIGLLPPPQLPPFKLATAPPPPPVSIRDQPDPDILRAPTPVSRSEVGMTRSAIELGRPIFAVAAIGAILAGGALFVGGQATATGVGIGAATATVNLWLFTRIGAARVTGRRRGAWGILGALKLILLFGAVFFILRSETASPLAFMIGYLALPVGIVAAQLFGLRTDFENGEGSI